MDEHSLQINDMGFDSLVKIGEKILVFDGFLAFWVDTGWQTIGLVSRVIILRVIDFNKLLAFMVFDKWEKSTNKKTNPSNFRLRLRWRKRWGWWSCSWQSILAVVTCRYRVLSPWYLHHLNPFFVGVSWVGTAPSHIQFPHKIFPHPPFFSKSIHYWLYTRLSFIRIYVFKTLISPAPFFKIKKEGRPSISHRRLMYIISQRNRSLSTIRQPININQIYQSSVRWRRQVCVKIPYKSHGPDPRTPTWPINLPSASPLTLTPTLLC